MIIIEPFVRFKDIFVSANKEAQATKELKKE